MNTLEFEKADTKEKIKQLADTADEIWHEYFTCILSESQIDYMVDRFQSEKAVTEQIANKNYSYFLVRLGGIIIGYVGISPEEETKKLFLSKFYLKKSARGRGYASQMFSFIFDIAKSRGLTSVYLTVNKHNDHSIAVYEHMGFCKVKAQVTDIGNGFVMDDFVMEKVL